MMRVYEYTSRLYLFLTMFFFFSDAHEVSIVADIAAKKDTHSLTHSGVRNYKY